MAEYAEDFIDETFRAIVDTYAPEGVFPEEWDLDELWVALEQIHPVGLDRDALRKAIADDAVTREQLLEQVLDDALSAYERREAELASEVLRQVERRVILSVVDRVWREHLYEMDHLREGIGLRAVGQRDPLVEYQREAYEAFGEMMAHIKAESTGYFFNLPVHIEPEPDEAAAAAEEAAEVEAEAERERRARASRQERPRSRGPPCATSRGRPCRPSCLHLGGHRGDRRQPRRRLDLHPGGAATATGSAGGSAPSGNGAAARSAQQTVRNTDKVGATTPAPAARVRSTSAATAHEPPGG